MRLAPSDPGVLQAYPYSFWFDSVLADLLPGLRWSREGAFLKGPIFPGLMLLLYATSPTEFRLDLTTGMDGESLAVFQYGRTLFSLPSFLSWFRVVSDHVERAASDMTSTLLGSWHRDLLLRVHRPQAGIDFPLSYSHMGARRDAGRFFEDFASLSRDTSLWPLSGLTVLVGRCRETNTRLAALLVRADRAAGKSRSLYAFRHEDVPLLHAYESGDLPGLLFCPSSEKTSTFLRSAVHQDAQTVVASLHGELTAEGSWVEDAQVLARNPTNRILVLRTDLEPSEAANLILDKIPSTSRVYWVQGAGRLCPVYGHALQGGLGAHLPCAVIFPPFA